MDRVLRIIGVTLVAGLALLAYRTYDDTLAAATESGSDESGSDESGPEVAGPADPDRDDADAAPGDRPTGSTTATATTTDDDQRVGPVDANGEPPASLAFAPSLDSRLHRVTTATGSSIGLGGPLASSADDYPLETDLFPGASLAVNGLIGAGVYASPIGAENCGYELRRIDPKTGEDRLIGHERLAVGRLLVTINTVEADIFRPLPQCGSWTPWSPLAEPLVTADNGDYGAGDLARGVWAVPEGCLWEKVVAFRGARLVDVVESARGEGELVIDRDLVGLRLRDCDTLMRLVEPEPGVTLDIGEEPGFQP